MVLAVVFDKKSGEIWLFSKPKTLMDSLLIFSNIEYRKLPLGNQNL